MIDFNHIFKENHSNFDNIRYSLRNDFIEIYLLYPFDNIKV